MSTLAAPPSSLPPLVLALRENSPTEHSRWLDESHDHALRALLLARYGNTYSYQSFYIPGTLTRLWRVGTLSSLGEFDDDTLISHTALIIKPECDYIESGLSLTHPQRRTAMDRDEHARMWQYVLGKIKGHVAFIHQNTSTLHRMAQRYASRFMLAIPTGLIVHYTQGETLSGMPSSTLPMHALTMTTPLEALSPRRRYLPAQHWGEWLSSIFEGLAIAPLIEKVPLDSTPFPESFATRPRDWNEELRIERRELVKAHPTEACAAFSISPRARVDLIHVSTGDAQFVSAAVPLLLGAGYLPTGIRLRWHEPDEMVFQHLPNRHQAASALRAAEVDGMGARSLFKGFIERCERTS